MLKILLVIDRLSNPYAGTEGQFILLIKQLMGAGVDVHALILNNSEWLSTNSLSCSFDVLGVSSLSKLTTWIGVYKKGRELKKKGYSLAHIFFNDSSLICPPMLKISGFKVIISRRDMGFWYTSFYKNVLPITGKFVDAVISNSWAVSRKTAEVERLPDEKLFVIYNGYDRPVNKLCNVDELQVLNDQKKTLIGIVANIKEIKRIDDAVKALSKIANEFVDLDLVVIGSGDSAPLEELADSLGIKQRVHFLGKRSDVTDCLQYFCAGLLCSESEGFSNSIIEYQYAGLPVICTNTGGNPEAVTAGVTGWLYPVGDVGELANCLRAFCSDFSRAKLMGAHAKENAVKLYSVEKMLKNHLAFYRKMLEI